MKAGRWTGRPGAVWQAVGVPRDPRQIQLEIDAARESLAATLDQLTYRTSPKRLRAKGRTPSCAGCRRPPAWPPAGAVGLLVTFVVVQRVRHRND